MSILISILLACHSKFQVGIEEGWLIEPVVFFTGITFTIKACPFFSILFCIFLITIWSRKKKGNRCDLKKTNYNKVINN